MKAFLPSEKRLGPKWTGPGFARQAAVITKDLSGTVWPLRTNSVPRRKPRVKKHGLLQGEAVARDPHRRKGIGALASDCFSGEF